MIFSAVAYALVIASAGAQLQNTPIYKHMDEWLAARSFTGKMGATSSQSDACLNCAGGVCTLLPPSGSGFPCYQGANKDANKCYNTDPLLPAGSTAICGVCADYGYPTYLQNDPIYKNMELWGKSSEARHEVQRGSDACLTCPGGVCTLLPPSGSHFPCYQGSNKDANFCYNTDPLLPEGSTPTCGVCEDYGYSTYLQNDPIYKNMELWTK